MNYIELLNMFYERIQCSRVSNNGQLLYYTLLAINNKSSWSDWFSRTNVSISGMMGISEKAFMNARAELKQMGLIDFVPSKKRGECTRYRILYPTKYSTNDSSKEVQTTVQSTDIDKLKLKQKKDSGESKETRMTPPTEEAVAEYCKNQGLSVDAAIFVSYYQSNGWMVGKDPMTDWMAAVRTWDARERREKKGVQSKSRNQFHNFEQRDTDYDALVLERVKAWPAGGEKEQ